MAPEGSGRAPGARDNGLFAAHYLPLADLDPRVADALLTSLRVVGVAAYVAPTPGVRGGYLETRLPARPSDRLFVASEAMDTARTVLRQEAPDADAVPMDVPEPDLRASRGADEAAWADIVASLSTPGPDAVVDSSRPWPRSEDVGRDFDAPIGFRTWSPPEDPADEHYIPPEPPPLPPVPKATRWAWLALIAGAVVLIVPAALGHSVGGGISVLSVLAIVGGFGTLVWRMRDSPRDDGPDDGAVV